MIQCAACGAEVQAGERLCSFCRYHSIAEEVLSDPGLPQIRTELRQALLWHYWQQAQLVLYNFAGARQCVDAFRAQDPKDVQSLAVAALEAAGWVGDPFGAEVLSRVSKAIGMSPAEAREFIENLKMRNVVQIEQGPTSTERSDMKPFPRLFRWVSCAPPIDSERDGE